MKRIDKWVTRDGAEFSDIVKAEAREVLPDKIDVIESLLPKKDESEDFANGYGYIQHDATQMVHARTLLIVLACEYVFSELHKYNIRSYAFSRYLYDNCSPLYHLYYRIVLCVDDATWREYGQPYYAAHPEEVKPV